MSFTSVGWEDDLKTTLICSGVILIGVATILPLRIDDNDMEEWEGIRFAQFLGLPFTPHLDNQYIYIPKFCRYHPILN